MFIKEGFCGEYGQKRGDICKKADWGGPGALAAGVSPLLGATREAGFIIFPCTNKTKEKSGFNGNG